MTTVPGGVDTAAASTPESAAGESNELRAVALTLEMQSSTTLLTVLTTIARLGCRTTHVLATQRLAILSVLAPRRLAHRLVPSLQELVDVLAVTECVCPQTDNDECHVRRMA
jgi:hypothetical protein